MGVLVTAFAAGKVFPDSVFNSIGEDSKERTSEEYKHYYAPAHDEDEDDYNLDEQNESDCAEEDDDNYDSSNEDEYDDEDIEVEVIKYHFKHRLKILLNEWKNLSEEIRVSYPKKLMADALDEAWESVDTALEILLEDE